MKTAEEIIKICEDWSKADRENHASFVVLTDKKKQSFFIHYAGDGRDMAKSVSAMMTEDEEFAHDIFAAAMVYAQKYIEQEEIDKITMVAKAIAEARKEQQK